MKNEFHRHPDGLIYVRAADGRFYGDTVENFEKDFGRNLPALGAAEEQVYTQDVRNAFMLNGNVVAGGPRRDQFLDNIIENLDRGLQAKAERELKVAVAEVNPLQDVLKDVPDDMELLVDTLVAEGIIPAGKRNAVVNGVLNRRNARQMFINSELNKVKK